MMTALRAHWDGLAPRERRLVAVTALLALGVILWLAVWRPGFAAWHALERRIAAQRADLGFVRDAVARLQATGIPVATGGALLGRAERSAREAGFGSALTRIAQEDGEAVVVELEGATFDALVAWLMRLDAQGGVRVLSLEVDRHASAGRIDARIVIAP